MLVNFVLLTCIMISNGAIAAVGEDFEFPASLPAAFSTMNEKASAQRIADVLCGACFFVAWIIYHGQLVLRTLLRLRRIRHVFGPPLHLGPFGTPDELQEESA